MQANKKPGISHLSYTVQNHMYIEQEDYTNSPSLEVYDGL